MRKHDLIKHLQTDHADRVRVPIVIRHWTVEALRDLHQSIHKKGPKHE